MSAGDAESEKVSLEENSLSISMQDSILSNSIVDENEEEPQETAELTTKGNVSRSLYLKYFRAGGSIFMIFTMVVCFALAQLFTSGCDYFIRYW